jgi:hypothetical protein
MKRKILKFETKDFNLSVIPFETRNVKMSSTGTFSGQITGNIVRLREDLIDTYDSFSELLIEILNKSSETADYVIILNDKVNKSNINLPLQISNVKPKDLGSLSIPTLDGVIEAIEIKYSNHSFTTTINKKIPYIKKYRHWYYFVIIIALLYFDYTLPHYSTIIHNHNSTLFITFMVFKVGAYAYILLPTLRKALFARVIAVFMFLYLIDFILLLFSFEVTLLLFLKSFQIFLCFVYLKIMLTRMLDKRQLFNLNYKGW